MKIPNLHVHSNSIYNHPHCIISSHLLQCINCLFFSQHNFVLFQQMYSNNAVVVSGSTSLPIVSAGSLASMMQVDFPCKKIRQDVVSLLLVSQVQWNMKNLFLKMDKVRTNRCYKLPAKNLDSFYAIILVVNV